MEENTVKLGDSPASPRLKLGQQSVSGLNVIYGMIMEEKNWALRWPQAIHTYQDMLRDATIAPAINLVELAISRVPWVVKVPEGMEDELADKKKFLEECMVDMENPWHVFIRQAATHNSYGFSASEKVYRKREISSGSKFNDGKYGLRKLAPIAQNSVDSWEFSDRGRNLVGLIQRPANVSNRNQSTFIQDEKEIKIPRKKFLLFRNNPFKDNPEGQSPLNDCYVAWRYKKALEEAEALGVSQDLRGMKVLYLPPAYLAEDADEEMKAVREYYERGLTMLHKNEQSSMILPMVRDDSGNKLFELEIVSVMGQKAHDTRAIINGYKKEIITCLFASQLILGQDGGGSYSLAESQSSVSQMVIDARLTEIRDQLNHDLIPQLFALNKWDVVNTPYFDFAEINEESLDEISKYIQRISAVGLMPKTPAVVNFVTDRLGIEPQFKGTETTEEMAPSLTQYESGAAEGLEQGSGNGTSSSSSKTDTSAANKEN